MSSKLGFEQVLPDVHDLANQALKVSVIATVPSAEAAIAAEGAPVPAEFKVIAGKDPSGNTKPLAVDASGNLIVDVSIPSGLATSAKQDTIISDLTPIASDLSQLNTKTTAVDTGNVTITSSSLPTGAATEVTLALAQGDITALNGKVTTVDTGNVTVSSSALPTGAATETTAGNIYSSLVGLVGKTAAGMNVQPFDEIVMTYVPSGPGVGQIATTVYKLATVTVATLTMTYNGSNQLTGVVRT